MGVAYNAKDQLCRVAWPGNCRMPLIFQAGLRTFQQHSYTFPASFPHLTCPRAIDIGHQSLDHLEYWWLWTLWRSGYIGSYSQMLLSVLCATVSTLCHLILIENVFRLKNILLSSHFNSFHPCVLWWWFKPSLWQPLRWRKKQVSMSWAGNVVAQSSQVPSVTCM